MLFDIELNDNLKKYELRDLFKEDIPKLVTLFREVFHKDWNEEFWHWFFYEHPFETFSLSLWDKDRLIGQYCGQKKYVSINGQKYECVLGSTAILDVDYRGQGLFIYLAKTMYNLLAEKGFLFFYGYPNEIYNCGLYFKKFSWEFCEKKTMFIKDLNKNSSFENQSADIFSINKVDELPNSINEIEVNRENGNHIIKNAEYLNWRFTKHPLNDYELYILKDSNNTLVGYFITKTFINNENKILN
ncbi:MAG: GNAT family N-acetyltransferase [Candidatus Odinarchaeota archaeon]